MSIEAAPQPKPDWTEYMFQMEHLAVEQEWDQLEALLMEPHPLLPGELESFNKLTEGLGRPLRIELDESGMHVKRIE